MSEQEIPEHQNSEKINDQIIIDLLEQCSLGSEIFDPPWFYSSPKGFKDYPEIKQEDSNITKIIISENSVCYIRNGINLILED